jgi:menaquinone-dependent protoporphyrinogen IX oxidase
MKMLVAYKSISGFTKRYAEWISDALGAGCVSLDRLEGCKIEDYDVLVFGGSLHAVGINGYAKFKSYIPRMGSDKIIIFAVGASPYKPGLEQEIKLANFKDPNEQNIPLFYLRGGFDYSKLDFANKILMRLLQWKLMLKKNKTPDERGMLMAYSKPLDAAKQERIAPIVEYVKTKAFK